MSVADVLDGRREWWIENVHVLDGLRMLPDESVNCVVTSPPYHGLRNYSTVPQIWGGDPTCDHRWRAATKRGTAVTPSEATKSLNHSLAATRQHLHSAFCEMCHAWCGELGQELAVEDYVDHLVMIFKEVRRALHPRGTVWLNIGDSHAGSGRGPQGQGKGKQSYWSREGARDGLPNRSPGQALRSRDLHDRRIEAGAIGNHWSPAPAGIREKNLCLIPERLSIALQSDGWWIRSRIAWCKLAPMPESVTDRPTSAWEHIWLLTKNKRYFYDADAVRTIDKGSDQTRRGNEAPLEPSGGVMPPHTGLRAVDSRNGHGANLRNYWVLGPEPYRDAHFATFPTELARRCILAGCPEGGVVLDPFSGSGTVVMVALRHNRRGIGLELNPEYVEMARRRVQDDAPLLNGISL